MSALKRIIKCFSFAEPERSTLVIGDGARLNPTTNRLELALDPGPFKGVFNTGPDITVRTRVTNPANVKQWLSFQALDHHVDDECGKTRLTRLQYRLTDGVDEFFWDGAQWAANTVDWNDEDEVSSNLPTFPVTLRSLGVIINLVTDDERFTPALDAIKILYSSDIEFQEDLVFRSIIPLMKQHIRPCADLLFVGDGSDEIDLSDVEDLETPYDIVGATAVYNETADPDKLVNILVSFDEGTKIITLSPGSLPNGETAWIKFQYLPQITVQTGQDFVEVDRLPSIILEGINLVDSMEIAENDHVVNKLTGDSVVVPGPIQGDLEIKLVGLTDKNTDQHRLADQIKSFFGNNKQMRSAGLDESFRLWLIDEYDMRASGDRAGVIGGEATFRIVGALWHNEDAYDAKAIHRFTMRFYPDGEAVDEEVSVATETVYWGAADPGANDAAYILALSETAPAFNRARKFTSSAAATEHVNYAIPQSFGTPRFFVGGFEGGWNPVAIGVDVNGTLYDLWQTINIGLGVLDVEVK